MVLVLDELLQVAGFDTGAGQIVQPDRDAVVGRALSCFSHIVFSFDSVMEQIFNGAPPARGLSAVPTGREPPDAYSPRRAAPDGSLGGFGFRDGRLGGLDHVLGGDAEVDHVLSAVALQAELDRKSVV